MKTLFSIYLWFLYGISFVISLPFVTLAFLISFPFDKNRLIPNRVFMFFGQMFLIFNPFWKVTINGLDKIDWENQGRVFIGNHSSFLDMPVAATLPWKMKWVSKKEIFKIPVAGWIMSMCGHVSIDRGKKTAISSMYGIVEYVKKGVPVMVYPEGTRSRDGELKPFKNGTFIIAKEYNFPVQPVVVYGTYEAMLPGSWKISKIKSDLMVTVLDPILPDQFSTMEEFRDYANESVKQEIQRLKELAAIKS